MNDFNLQLGAKVHCQDGPCGTLAKIAIAPDTFTVKRLIIAEGRLLKRDTVFPIKEVHPTKSGHLQLQLSGEKLHDYPQYEEVEFKRPANGWDERQGYQPRTTPKEMIYPAFAADYDPNVALVPDKIHEGISPEFVVITEETNIKNAESVRGKLAQIAINASHFTITSITIQQGLLFPGHITLPITFVQYMTDDEIFLSVTDQELEQFLETEEEPTL